MTNACTAARLPRVDALLTAVTDVERRSYRIACARCYTPPVCRCRDVPDDLAFTISTTSHPFSCRPALSLPAFLRVMIRLTAYKHCWLWFGAFTFSARIAL